MINKSLLPLELVNRSTHSVLDPDINIIIIIIIIILAYHVTYYGA